MDRQQISEEISVGLGDVVSGLNSRPNLRDRISGGRYEITTKCDDLGASVVTNVHLVNYSTRKARREEGTSFRTGELVGYVAISERDGNLSLGGHNYPGNNGKHAHIARGVERVVHTLAHKYNLPASFNFSG